MTRRGMLIGRLRTCFCNTFLRIRTQCLSSTSSCRLFHNACISGARMYKMSSVSQGLCQTMVRRIDTQQLQQCNKLLTYRDATIWRNASSSNPFRPTFISHHKHTNARLCCFIPFLNSLHQYGPNCVKESCSHEVVRSGTRSCLH